MLNSTIGIAGFIDVATAEGLARQSGDFGQTLYVWGLRNSPFIVVPVVGPTNVRDAFGNGVELAAQIFLGTMLPASAATATSHVGAVGTVTSPVASLSKVEQMQELELSSLDFYSMLRSVVEQKRQAELRAALRESPLSGLPRLDRSGPEVDLPLISPALIATVAVTRPRVPSFASTRSNLLAGARGDCDAASRRADVAWLDHRHHQAARWPMSCRTCQAGATTGIFQPPARSLSPCRRSELISASGPPDFRIAVNSALRLASSLMVPSRKTSTTFHSAPLRRIK